ncbi:MAG TPA: hypothetical protein VMI75_25310 [Polyangiaceae bacterium]|nr:hypothetical protein [Polyangiaceae bacterium]
MKPLSPSAAARFCCTAGFAFAALLLVLATPLRTAHAANAPSASIPDGSAAPEDRSGAAAQAAALWEKLGLPHYVAPDAYREHLVITSQGQTIDLVRVVDGTRTRTEMNANGEAMVMIELGDERGTTYQLVPERKMAVKQSRAAMDEMSGRRLSGAEADTTNRPKRLSGPPPDMKLKDLGDEMLNGAAARKFEIASSQGVVTAWFEKATGAPLEMKSTVDGRAAVVEWKERKAGPQDATLFQVPGDYQLQDMDAMMEKMKGMGGMGAMAQGMLSGMADGMGSSMGSSLGATLGASLGGPLGAVAGQYIGGRIGGMLAHKVAGAPQ